MSIELRRIRTFVAIAEHGGFTVAGNVLGLTQSAISNQMRALENDLGVELFDRTKRPPVLNAHGIGILSNARAILRAYSELSGDQRTAKAPSGVIRIASTATPAVSLIPEVLEVLDVEAPLVRAIITTGMSQDICHRVAQGDVDCGLITDLGTLPMGLSCVPVKRDSLIAIVPASSKAQDFPEALKLHPFISVSKYTSVSQLIERQMIADGLEASGRFELDSFEAIVQLVRRGVGCAIVATAALEACSGSDVRSLPFGSETVMRTIMLVERSAALSSPRMTIFRDVLMSVAARGPS
jgi:DNA-binding transcriptional LysR family regulator